MQFSTEAIPSFRTVSTRPPRRAHGATIAAVAIALFTSGCADNPSAPVTQGASRLGPLGLSATSWGPETPHFNLEVILRGDNDAFGHVKFRQPNDADRIVYLDVWVRDLAPNTSYMLQRATDTNVNDDCLGTNWLTLGLGATPLAIVTDDRGTGRAELFRNLGTTAVGSEFDIHFRVIRAGTSEIVLTSECYQFTVSQ